MYITMLSCCLINIHSQQSEQSFDILLSVNCLSFSSSFLICFILCYHILSSHFVCCIVVCLFVFVLFSSSLSSTPLPLPPPSAQHKLQAPFTFWYLNKKIIAGATQQTDNYEDAIKKMATFHTVN
jgi:hypothetical protein